VRIVEFLGFQLDLVAQALLRWFIGRWVLAEKFRGSFIDLGLCKQINLRFFFSSSAAVEVSGWI
jgi:hypothetical protein